MVGLIQIVIYLLAVYLVYKGFEILQIALVAPVEHKHRQTGIVIGVLAVCLAICGAFLAVSSADGIAAKIGNLNLPR